MKKSELFPPKLKFKKCVCGYCRHYQMEVGETISIKEKQPFFSTVWFRPNKTAKKRFWLKFKCFEKV